MRRARGGVRRGPARGRLPEAVPQDLQAPQQPEFHGEGRAPSLGVELGSGFGFLAICVCFGFEHIVVEIVLLGCFGSEHDRSFSSLASCDAKVFDFLRIGMFLD